MDRTAPADALDLGAYLARFGLSSFRPGQRQVIETVVAGRDALCVMPTGGGKSLCYQLPALALPGVALVVSPLIALMKDQVDTLRALGIRATFINSTLSPAEQDQRLADLAAGGYDLMYVVPERFRSPRFIEAVRQVRLALLAVDEAHCVSEWGHDFRPDYARLGEFRRRLGSPPTIALTATATPTVQDDIVELLALREPSRFVTGFNRPNLHYEVQAPTSQAEKDDLLIAFLQETPGAGIIYAATRKRCEEIHETILSRTKRRSLVYHAGLPGDDRRRGQEAFMSGKAEVIVATNAFGMGIDKPDVRFVVHYNMPGTVEAYYQEAGRAGRDGRDSRCLLLFSASDRYVQEFFIENAYPSEETFAAVYEFLCTHEDDPIELTQEEIKDHLALETGGEGIGQCERLLQKAGVLERLDPCRNMAVVQLSSDLPTLVDLLPKQAGVQRKVLRAVEKIVGPHRYEMVYFHRNELLKLTQLEWSALSRALANLRELEAFDYVPPFRGRAIHMLRRDVPLDELDIDFDQLAQRKAAEYDKLAWIIRFAKSGGCRQQEILAYFGEESQETCGTCDNCSQRGGPSDGIYPIGRDDPLFQVVQMVLSGVARTHGRFGRNLVAQMLCGSTAENLKRFGLHRLSTHGLLKELKQTEVVVLVDALIEAGCLGQVTLEPGRPLVQLTERGELVMRARDDLQAGLKLPRELMNRLRAVFGGAGGEDEPAGRTSDDGDDDRLADETPPADPMLLAALKRWRIDQASREGVAAFRVLSNRVLEQIAASSPCSHHELLEIRGIGPAKLEQYGSALLDVIRSAMPEEDTAPRPDDTAEVQDVTAAERNGQPDDATAPHYWTWRLIEKGFPPAECAAIRGIPEREILRHALAAARHGRALPVAWGLTREQRQALERLVGTATPSQIEPLLSQLPPGTLAEHVELYLASR